MISLINYYDWKKFSIVYEEVWTNVATSLKLQAEKKNMTVNHIEKILDVRKCCENNWECCVGGYWYSVSKHNINFKKLLSEKDAIPISFLEGQCPV